MLNLRAKYSVIIPVYNVEQYINKCIDSIIKQNYPDLEIVLVDDHSTDGSEKICEEYFNKYEFVKLYRNKVNKGLSFSRNFGMQNASGKYIWFIDSDDYIEFNSFNILDYTLNKRENLDILYFDFKEIYKDHENVITILESEGKSRFYGGNVSRCIYKMDFIRKLNLLFPVNLYSEDLFFNTIAVSQTNSFEYIKIPLYNYRRTVKSSLMNKRSMKLINDVLTITQMIINQFELKSDKTEIVTLVLNHCVGRLFDFLLFCIIDYPENALEYHYKVIKVLNETGIDWKKSDYFNANGNLVLKIPRCLMRKNFGIKILKMNCMRKLIKKRIDRNRA